jgi:hypothetical protein
MGNEGGERAGSVVAALLVTAAGVAGIYAALVTGIYFWVVRSWPTR